MPQKKTFSFFILSAVICTILSGCGRQTDQNIDRGQQAQETAMTLFYEGNTNAAIQTLNDALLNRKIEPQSKIYLFNNLINILLKAGQADTAKERFLAAEKETPDLLQNALGRIMSYYQQTNNQDALMAWGSQLMELNLPEKFKQSVTLQLAQTLLIKDQINDVLAMINDRVANFAPQSRNRTLQALINFAIKNSKLDDAEKILASAGKLSEDDPELKVIIKIANIDILFGRKEWDKGIDQLKSAATQIQDNFTSSLVRRSLDALNNNTESARIDMLCKHIIQNNKNLSNTCMATARIYLTNAKNKPQELVNRLVFLEKHIVEPKAFFTLYRTYIYNLLGTNDKAVITTLYDISKRLAPSLEENNAQSMKLITLDLTFILEDYAASIALVKSRIPGQDDAWHAFIIRKLEAHLALQQGRHEDAIKSFRDFMKLTEEINKPESDPTTGILHTTEMILGRNAKRIGDIYLSINKKEDAAKAYTEAKQYYIEASNTIDKRNTKSIDVINKGTAELAEAKKSLSLN